MEQCRLYTIFAGCGRYRIVLLLALQPADIYRPYAYTQRALSFGMYTEWTG